MLETGKAKTSKNSNFCLYPVHFEASKTLSQGRKYPISICALKIKIQEIRQALTKLKIEFREEMRRHPKDQGNIVCFYITPEHSTLDSLDKSLGDSLDKSLGNSLGSSGKKEIIRSIAEQIKEQRSKQTETSSKVPNLLNLVPKKKKSKK